MTLYHADNTVNSIGRQETLCNGKRYVVWTLVAYTMTSKCQLYNVVVCSLIFCFAIIRNKTRVLSIANLSSLPA